jgi:alcohol dehydrogenase
MTIAELELTTASAATPSTSTTMKALVYHGPGKRAWENKPRPHRGSGRCHRAHYHFDDLRNRSSHSEGRSPSVAEGRILGHEGIGVIEQVGTDVSEFHIGDKVIISCVTACLKCDFCRRGMYSHCRRGGWILGNTLDGTQAGYVRIPTCRWKSLPLPAG